MLVQPLWLRRDEVPMLPSGWRIISTEEASIQLPAGQRYDNKTVSENGSVPVINQSEDGLLGFHNDEPGVIASEENPVVTFANHTCAMRLMKEPFSSIQNVFPKVGKPDVCDTVYFYYASLGRVHLTDYKGHHPIFREALIPIPPITVQKSIAKSLSFFDDLIENNKKRIKILEDTVRLVYREWFVHYRFPDHEKVQMVDSGTELGEVPEGWKLMKLSDVADVNACSVKAKNAPTEINYVDIASVSTGTIDKIERMDFSDAPSRARRIIRSGDILWSTVRPNRKSYCLVIDPPNNLIASTGFAVISSKKLPYTYLYQFLTTEGFVAYLVNHARGAAYPAVNTEDFENATILIPDPATLDAFNVITEPISRCIAALQQRNSCLREARDLLLPKLISGQLTVA